MYRKFLISLLAVFICISPALGDDNSEYKPQLDVSAKFGNKRVLTTLELMMPIKQLKDSLLFVDLRFVASDHEEFEGNAGLGYRHVYEILDQDYIWGVYGFIDRRKSSFDNYFTQATAGTELLGLDWRFRINYYRPLQEEKLIEDLANTASLQPNGFVLVDSGITYEKALHGVDLELGRRLPVLNDTWGHIAYYKFGQDDIDVKGVRLRGHTQVTDWLRFGVEASFDNVRDDNYFAELRVRVPFNRLLGKKRTSKKQKSVHQYMMEPIVRDIDIVTQAAKAPSAPAQGPNGKPEKFIFVDNTAPPGGDGTPGNPFDNLTDAIDEANKKNDDNTIFVRQGDGTTTNLDTGIDLDEKDLRFIGSKIDLTTRDGLLVESATLAPLITNTAGDAVTILADNIEVGGFSIDSPNNDGIFLLDQDNANIHDNDILGAGDNAINAAYVSNKAYNLTITDNTANTSALKGIIIRSYNGADVVALVNNNTANSNSQSGIQHETGGTNSALDITMSANTTNGNGANAGLNMLASGSSDLSVNVTNHIASNNTQDGMRFLVGGSGTHNLVADNISVTNSGDTGIRIDIQDSTTATTTLSNSSAITSGGDGLNIKTRSSTALTANITNHTSNGAANTGVDIIADGTSTNMDITLDNIVSNSSTEGIGFTARSGSTLNALITNSSASLNTVSGLKIIGGNTANLSLEVEDIDITASASNSIFFSNTTTGIYNPDLGGGSLGSLGQNRVFGGGSFDILGDLNGSTIAAQSNWWGSPTGLNPINIDLLSGGSIDSSNFLTSDPRP